MIYVFSENVSLSINQSLLSPRPSIFYTKIALYWRYFWLVQKGFFSAYSAINPSQFFTVYRVDVSKITTVSNHTFNYRISPSFFFNSSRDKTSFRFLKKLFKITLCVSTKSQLNEWYVYKYLGLCVITGVFGILPCYMKSLFPYFPAFRSQNPQKFTSH